MRGLRAALVFLTRVPVRMVEATPLPVAVPWFPVAGLVIGAATGGVSAGLLHIVPPLVAAAVVVAFSLLLTGAFHEDGLADVADAFAGGWTREDRLRILDDPLHGSYGVAAMCATIVVRVAAIASLGASPAAAFACLVAAHGLARASAVALLTAMPNARSEGLAAGSTATLSRPRAITGIVATTAIAALAVGWWAGPFAAAAALASATTGWLAWRKIGGVSGDVLGAAEQVAESLVLVVASGVATRYALWWAG